jgi:hypothetical protein
MYDSAQKRLDFQDPPLPMLLVMDLTRLKTVYVPRHINNRDIDSYKCGHQFYRRLVERGRGGGCTRPVPAKDVPV